MNTQFEMVEPSDTAQDVFNKMSKNCKVVEDLLESVLWQACADGDWVEGKGGRVCNSGLKAYEEAMEFLSGIDRIRDYNGICGWLVE